MKFTWFHLMPYRWLPADFRERYHSVWVDLPNGIYDPEKGHDLYNEYLDMLEYAEQCGFDAIAVNEHHQNAYGMMPSPNIMAATLARRTSKAMLLVLGNSIVCYNPPTRIAEEFAMLDVISGGRLIAGFPVGTSMDINYCSGQNPATVRDKYREGHDLIMKAWQTREPFAFNGKYTKLRYVNLWPRPIQQPHPPVWIPGLGSIETWDFCAQHDYNYSYLSFSRLQARAQHDERLLGAARGAGRRRQPAQRRVLPAGLHQRDGRASARRSGGRTSTTSSTSVSTCIPGTSEAPGYRSEASLRAGVVAQFGNTSQNMGNRQDAGSSS